ncbi:hypothetical protein SLE2022_129380 [Rubroshorea leprosula]
MFKNQLQELAQRSCFNLPAYSCIREGPDHAPRFKATVNFNGETFESPTFCSTLRQAEHAAAEVALNTLANRGPSKALAAKVLDETGVYKNLLQETAHRAGLNLPVYTTMKSGPGHVPAFSCTVELAGMSFIGEPARTKKQAQKNAAMAAWSALKKLSQCGSSSSTSYEEQEQVVVARFLSSFRQSESRHSMRNNRQHEKQRSIPLCMELTPPTPSLYSIRNQSWPYPILSPEMVYQMWQQEQLFQLQNHLFTVPVSPAPAPPPVAQILPHMRSIFHPDHHLSVPARVQEPIPRPRLTIATSRPSLCLSNDTVTDLGKGKSRVTIQEIQEEITEESTKFSPPLALDSHVPSHASFESRREESNEDHKQKNVELESKVKSMQSEGDQNGQSEQASLRRFDTGARPTNSQFASSRAFNSSHSYLRPQYPPRAVKYENSRLPSPAPVMIRSVAPVSSMRPRSQNLATPVHAPPRMRTGAPPSPTRPRFDGINLGGMHPNSMAPAVRIRSVVPVCAAPPPRQIPSFNQEGMSPNKDKEDAGAAADGVSKATSQLDKLNI